MEMRKWKEYHMSLGLYFISPRVKLSKNIVPTRCKNGLICTDNRHDTPAAIIIQGTKFEVKLHQMNRNPAICKTTHRIG